MATRQPRQNCDLDGCQPAASSASCAGMRKRTFSVTPGKSLELDLAELAQPVDQRRDQLGRGRRAGGDADRRGALRASAGRAPRRRRSDSSARRFRRRFRAAGSSSSCSGRRPPAPRRRPRRARAPRAGGFASRSRCPWCRGRRSSGNAPCSASITARVSSTTERRLGDEGELVGVGNPQPRDLLRASRSDAPCRRFGPSCPRSRDGRHGRSG